MRILPAFCLFLTACGGEETVVLGELAEAGVTHVWLVGGSEPAEVADGAFQLRGVQGDTLDLRFATGGEELARMEVLGPPDGGRLTLRGIWIDGGMAHPTAVEVAGGETVLINGLRLGGAELVPREPDLAGTVLAASGAGDALLVRPADARLPDLRVVVTPATLARTPDGDPAPLEELEFGDSVRVRGAFESGYLIAAEVVVPRGAAAERDRERSAGVAGAAAGAAAATAGRTADVAERSERRGSIGERIRERWDRARGKGGAGKGGGKAQGKGKGKGKAKGKG